MSFREEVRNFMSERRNETKMIEILRQELIALRATNKDLLDRLMARNFEELKVYQEDVEPQSVVEKALAPDEDETNAGEVI